MVCSMANFTFSFTGVWHNANRHVDTTDSEELAWVIVGTVVPVLKLNGRWKWLVSCIQWLMHLPEMPWIGGWFDLKLLQVVWTEKLFPYTGIWNSSPHLQSSPICYMASTPLQNMLITYWAAQRHNIEDHTLNKTSTHACQLHLELLSCWICKKYIYTFFKH